MSTVSDTYTRIAVVTGATSGIGEATARKFAGAGFGVVGNARARSKLSALEKEIGQAFCGIAGDAAEEAIVEKLFTAADDRFGRKPDVVVVNAGRGLGGPVTDVDLEQFKDVLRTNVSGALALMKSAARRLVAAQQDGFPESPADIVVIGSVVGRHISPFSAVYGASKAAVHSLTESLRREVGSKGVRVTLVEPGFVLSGFQAVAGYSDEMIAGVKEKFGPLLTGADVADAIYYVVSQPPHVHISDLLIRPTRQDYP
ncbi:MAG: SDR family oxidoreductase [Arenicellales bacterium]|jgi:NADP-dependent 3-hydroxy acid dehydrogenase YdfG